MRGWIRARVRLLIGLLAGIVVEILVAAPASAQVAVPPPPVPYNVDERGVDLANGGFVTGSTDVSIGPANEHGLQFTRQWVKDGWRIAELPTMNGSTSNPIVAFGGRSVPFHTSGGVYVPDFADGSTLSTDRATFTASDGTVILFQNDGYGLVNGGDATLGVGTTVTYPDETQWLFSYNNAVDPSGYWIYCDPYYGCVPIGQIYYYKRLTSIRSTTGFQIKLTYNYNTGGNVDPSTAPAWSQITKATAINNTTEYCDPVAPSCYLANSWPEATYTNWTWGSQISSFTPPARGATTYSYDNTNAFLRLTGIQLPGTSTKTIGYDTSQNVSSVTVGAGTWQYNHGSAATAVTNPLAHTTNFSHDSAGHITQVMDPLFHATTYSYCGGGQSNCPSGLLYSVTQQENDQTLYTYDARGNQTSATRYPKLGGTPIVTYATYPASCSGTYTLKNCNKPISTRDANGNVTNYSWDGTHGGLTQVQRPAATSGGARPTTNISYWTFNARYLTGAGTWTNSPSIYLPTSTGDCPTAATCTASASERVNEIAYPASTVANNALPSSVTVRSGNAAIVETTAISYDNYGNVSSINGPLPDPLSGPAPDQTVAFYNLAGQITGSVGPDPDDGESASYRAQRVSYDTGGRPTLVEQGTATAQTSAALAAMTVTGSQVTGYDTVGRAVTVTSKGSDNVAFALAQTGYNAAGQVTCVATRMNPDTFSSFPATGACSLGTTSTAYGPDRITSYHYDAIGRADSVTTAYGTSDAATEQTLTFTPNGRVATVKDAENNLTTYEYDGFDRLLKTRFPDPAKGANSSSTIDYEQYGLDPNGNITSLRTRRGETLSLTYDNLNRVTRKTVPERSGLDRTYTRDVFYSYDLLGDPTSACFGNTTSSPETVTGDCVDFTYDAPGRKLTETQVMDGNTRTLTSLYDAANNRTRLVYPDSPSNFVDYVYHSSGVFHYASLFGTSYLFRPTRNSAAQPNALYRWSPTGATWNNFQTGFGYDAAGRVSAYWNDLAGTTYDESKSFAFNPASQIVSSSMNNDLYASRGAIALGLTYSANGLNQYASVGGQNYTYDASGNLTSDGAKSYLYDVENRLVWLGTGAGTTLAAVRYDPLGRAYEVYGSSTGYTRFLYDGDDLVAEYNASGTLLRRYVHGVGEGDDPLVWFEGATVADSARRYLAFDERGSVTAVTDASGNIITNGPLTGVNSYDEYGIPDNVTDIATKGRFRYTGQAYFPELGMYYYKARMYSPTLGRFMQTDPIGYGDGMNMYRYAQSDPVNGIDPSGLAWTPQPACPPMATNGSIVAYGGCGGWNWDGNNGYVPPYSIVSLLQPDTTGYSPPSGGAGPVAGPQQPQKDKKTTWQKFKACAAAQYGFGDGDTPTGLDFGKMVSELGALPIPKALIGVPVIGNSSRFTNAVSYIPFKLGIRMNTGMQILGSGRVFGVLGRANVIVGGAMLAWDATSIAICTARDK